MRAQIPDLGARFDPLQLRSVLEAVRRAFGRASAVDEAQRQLLLQSSGGHVYSVTVDDAGTLSTTLVKSVPPPP